MRLEELIDPDLVFADLPCLDQATVLRTFAERLAATGRFSDPDELYEKLWEREQLGSTGVGDGVAVPHCKMAEIDRVVVGMAVLRQGVDFRSVDQQPVRLIFLVISPEDQPSEHLKCLAAISKWVKADHHLEDILTVEDRESIYALLREEG